MGCGASRIEHKFDVYLLSFEKTVNPEEYLMKEVTKDILTANDDTEGFNLVKHVLSCKKQAFLDYFETDESIKDCIFCIYYDDKIRKKFVTYKEALKYNPYKQVRDRLGDSPLKVFVFNLKEHCFNITIDAMKLQFDSELDIIGKIVKDTIANAGATNSYPKDGQNDENIEGEIYEADVEVEGMIMFNLDGVAFDIIRELTSENINEHLAKIDNEKITSFSIRHNHFSKLSHFKNIMEKLYKIETLHTFTFSENHNTTGFDAGWQLITKLLEENTNIRHINLSMSFLYEKFVESLIKAIKGKKIYTLDLSSNFITYSGAKKIAEWLKRNRSLKVLNLQQNTMNEFKREGSDIIVTQLIKYHSLINLDLSHMTLTGFGLKMSEYIKTTTSLKELRIRQVRMNFEDFNFITEALCLNNSLEDVNIGDNYPGNDKCYELIAKVNEENKTIKSLNLDKLEINKKGLRLILNAIEKNEIMEGFSFNENQSKIPIEAYLEFFLKRNPLKSLSIVNKDYRKNGDGKDLIEKFKTEKEEVVLKT
jgi:hypothetical protein